MLGVFVAAAAGGFLALEGWQLRQQIRGAQKLTEIKTALLGLDGESGMCAEIKSLRTSRHELISAVTAVNAAVAELQEWRRHLEGELRRPREGG